MQLSQLPSLRCSLFLALACGGQQQPSTNLRCVLLLQDSMAFQNSQHSRIAFQNNQYSKIATIPVAVACFAAAAASFSRCLARKMGSLACLFSLASSGVSFFLDAAALPIRGCVRINAYTAAQCLGHNSISNSCFDQGWPHKDEKWRPATGHSASLTELQTH